MRWAMTDAPPSLGPTVTWGLSPSGASGSGQSAGYSSVSVPTWAAFVPFFPAAFPSLPWAGPFSAARADGAQARAAMAAMRNERRVMLGRGCAFRGRYLRGANGAVGSFVWGACMRDVLGFLFLLYICACVAVASPFFIDLLLG